MLVEGEDSLYLALYDSEKNLISSYSNLNQNDINNYIENLENEKEFFISWEEEKSSDYLKLDEKLISYLLGQDNFVNADFEIIEKKEVENLALFIRNNKEIEDRLDIYIEINDNLLTKNNIVGNYIYSQGTFYKVDIEEDTQFSLSDLFQKIDKYELESYATLILKNYKNIDLKYEDYETVVSEERNAIPQIIIEKISFDNSLYIKINSIISTMDYEFFTKNKIETVLIVNELEKKLEISKINLENLSSDMFEIVKVLTKLQKTIGLKSSYYIDNENFIILNEELAKEFVKKELLQLTGRYSIIGTDRLRKYNIKAVRPKLSGKFSYILDYFEGEVEVEIEGEKFSIQQLLNNYKKDEYIVLSDGTNALINREYIEKLQRVFKEEDGNKIKVSFFDMPIVQDMIDEKAFENDFLGNKDFFEGINELPKEEVEYPKLNATLRDYQKYGYKWLKYLTDNNLHIYLQSMFDKKVTNIIEYSALSEESRFLKLLDYLVNDVLKGEEEEFINNIKEGFELVKEGKISQEILIRNLKKLNGYEFGNLDIVKKSPLKEENKEEIVNFLKEKGFESFDELSKCNPFLTEEELIQKILNYQKRIKEEMNE